MARLARLAMLLLVPASVAACAKAQARVPEPPAPLATPPPPPRTHIPVTIEIIEPPAPPSLPAEPAPTGDPAGRSGGAGGTAGTKVPERPAPPPATPPPSPETSTSILQTAGSTALEDRAKKLLDSAARNLSLVQERELSPGARDQYHIAQRFVRQARRAMDAKNFVYATQLADNADTLAKLLAKR